MPTSCRTHDYDGQLREKWFEMRPMLLENIFPHCPSFDETINQIQEWLERKYYNVKRIGRARRAMRILTSQRRNNFDSRNDIDVEELLPILWNQVKDKDDLHDTFYEQLCDITGKTDEQEDSEKKSLPVTTTDVVSTSDEQQQQSNQATVPEEGEEVSLSVEATADEDEQQQSSIVKQTDEESRMSTQENPEDVPESQSEQIVSPSTE